jgi:hypothetical protein
MGTGFRKKSCLINNLERGHDSSPPGRADLTFAFRQAVKAANIYLTFAIHLEFRFNRGSK